MNNALRRAHATQPSYPHRRDAPDRCLTIGVIATEHVFHYLPLYWSGMVAAARQYGIRQFCYAGGAFRSPEAFLAQGSAVFDLIDPAHFDGFIIWADSISPFLTQAEKEAFCRRYASAPVVILGSVVDGFPSICKGEYQGMRDALIHLIEGHGYRHIAFLRGPQNHTGAEERYRAYRDTLAAYALPFDARLVTPPRKDWDGAAMIATLLDDQAADVDVVVAVSDFTALGVLGELQRRGLRVPEDLPVIGYDDNLESPSLTPSLTTIRAPFHELCQEALAMLLDVIAGKAVPDHVIIPTRLIVRESCGCLLSKAIQAAAPMRSQAPAAAACRRSMPDHRAELLEHLLHTAQESLTDIAPDVAARFLDLFLAEVQTTTSDRFAPALNHMLRETVTAGGNVEGWHQMVSVMRQALLPDLHGAVLARAENLWQQARVAISEAVQRVEIAARVRTERQVHLLYEISQTLLTTFNIAELMAMLPQGFSRLGIPGAYLALYVDPAHRLARSRLMLAYQDHQRIDDLSAPCYFSSTQLLPEGILPDDRACCLVVQPLYFHEEQLGFMLLEAGPREWNIYESLRGQISNALYGARLVQAVQERSAEVARQKYIVDTFIETVPDRIWFKDRDSRFTRVNKAHAARFGLSDPSAEIGKTDADFLGENIGQQTAAEEREIVRTGQAVLNREGFSTRPDGVPRWSLMTKMPLRDEHGAIIGTFGISRDITPLKTTEAALQAAKDTAERAQKAAEDANRAKSEFLAHMSHELRTPLNGILGYAQVLDRDRGLTAQQREAVSTIQSSGQHLLTLINDILDLAKIEARKIDMAPAIVNFPHFIGEIMSLMCLRAEQKQVVARYEPLTPVPETIYADERRLRQILLNLLGNAVKFTKSGGHVTLRVSSIVNCQLRFEIEDTGIGMTPDQLRKIFQPFEQVGDREFRDAGTGLGLAISQQIVGAMGGVIQVSSVFGQGSTFWFEVLLPVMMDAHGAEPERARTLIGYKGRRQQVLIVDDLLINRDVLRDLLSPLGFEIRTAQNGQDALVSVSAAPPDLLFIDLFMPGRDGFEVIQQMRQRPETSAIPIIVVSASALESDQERCRRLGCQGFLVKPVNAQQLFAMLEQCLPVEWIVADFEAEAGGDQNISTGMADHAIIPPALDDLRALYDFALKGDFFSLRSRMAAIEHHDRTIRPFISRLLPFVDAYQQEPILTFLERYIHDAARQFE